MTTPGQTVGQRVRLARTARGYGVNELDRLIGVPQGYVSRLEGSDREPRADSLRKLAQALGVGVEWLATGEGEMGVAGAAQPAPAQPTPVQPTPTPGAEVVYDDGEDPYPNRSRAIALLGRNLDPRARAVLLSYRFRSGGGHDEDLSLELWLGEAKNLQRQVRRLDREFAAIEREEQAGEGADEPTGWTPIPSADEPPPERLHHARARRRRLASAGPGGGASAARKAPTLGVAGAPKRGRRAAKLPTA
jgi:transcriptional regulator with XRE-family HTH domain